MLIFICKATHPNSVLKVRNDNLLRHVVYGRKPLSMKLEGYNTAQGRHGGG